MAVHALSDPAVRRAARKAAAPQRSARGGAAPTRASLIADFLCICELDPAVESLRPPGDLSVFRGRDRMIEHRADFEIVRGGVASLVDVASDADLARHPLRAALAAGAVECESGRAFAIETAATIGAEPRFSTVRLIMACRRAPVTAGDRVRILHYLDECGTARLVDCAGAVQNSADGVAAVLALAVEGLIAVDISRPILPETPVRRRKLPYGDPFGF